MHIGIDLDNTIIDYSNVFGRVGVEMHILPVHFKNKRKQTIKKFLLTAGEEGEQQWMKLQGQVYGPKIHLATLMDGMLMTLSGLLSMNYQVSIISHKTIYGHFTTCNTELRHASTNFLRQKNLLSICPNFSEKNIYYLSTLDEKIDAINNLNCDVFIDDLPKVFEHKSFPKKPRKILFGDYKFEASSLYESAPCWPDIAKKLNLAPSF